MKQKLTGTDGDCVAPLASASGFACWMWITRLSQQHRVTASGSAWLGGALRNSALFTAVLVKPTVIVIVTYLCAICLQELALLVYEIGVKTL